MARCRGRQHKRFNRLESATNLTWLGLNRNNITDISAVSKLTNLIDLRLERNTISDVSAVSGLTDLTRLELGYNTISDLSPLSVLTNLTVLLLWHNNVTDLSALTGLTNITGLYLQGNSILDLSPLVSNTGVGHGDEIDVRENPLNAVSINTHIPTLQRRGIDIQFDAVVGKPDLVVQSPRVSKGTLSPSESFTLSATVRNSGSGGASGTTLRYYRSPNSTISRTDTQVGTDAVGSLNSNSNSADSISLIAPTTPGTYYYGACVDAVPNEADTTNNCSTAVSVTVQSIGVTEPEPEVPATTSGTTVSLSPASVASPGVDQQLTFSLKIAGGTKVTGYQATVHFDTSALRYVDSANGDYLPSGAFFVPPIADGNSVTVAGTSLSGESARNIGTLATVTFAVVAVKASTVHLSEVLLTDSAGGSSSPQIQAAEITESPQLPEDVNQDGVVNILDLTLVASNFGKTGQNDADVNGDGIVNILDLVAVAGALGNAAAAPSAWYRDLEIAPTRATVGQWLVQAQTLDLTDATSQRGVLFLEQLLAALVPKQTALLPNYPNPFNPETWIPYQLADPAKVTLTIYDMNGGVVRRLEVGHQPAGIYQSRSRAAYWDGRNEIGERVTSGLYFYALKAREFTATRKMLVVK